MNTIKEIDILDKSKYTLNNLFKGEIAIFDKELYLSDNKTIINGTLLFNGLEFSFIVLSRPTAGKIVSLFNSTINPSKNIIFILDYASEEVINFFRSHDMFFADTAGNCFINLPSLKVSIEGKKNILSKLPETKIAFQKTGLKLIFQLLLLPDLAHKSFRKISKATNISIASISTIFEELKADGFIVERNDNKRNLSNIQRLITKWAINYTEVLRPKIHRGYFKSMDIIALFNNLPHNKVLYPDEKNELYIGGECGVYFLNEAIKPQNFIFYSNIRLSRLVERYRIIPISKLKNDSQQIEILEVFWNNDIKKNYNSLYKKQIPNYPIVNPILIYADLINSNNYRSVKAAEDLLENEIRNRFIQHNFQW